MTDVNITIIDRENIAHQVVAPTDMGLNLMELCKANELPVEGICGGMALCSTCHCYVESDTILQDMEEAEEDMLDQAFNVAENSRLGCQIPITESLEGLTIKLAPE